MMIPKNSERVSYHFGNSLLLIHPHQTFIQSVHKLSVNAFCSVISSLSVVIMSSRKYAFTSSFILYNTNDM